MKRFFKLFFIILFLFVSLKVEATEPINAYLFYGQDCPHCAKESEFLESLKEQYPQLEIRRFEIYYNQDNAKLMQTIAQTLNINISGVPFLFIEDQYFIGYTENITSTEIKNKIDYCLNNNCSDVVKKILDLEASKEQIVESEKIIINSQDEQKEINSEQEQIINFSENKENNISEIIFNNSNNEEQKKISIPFFGVIDIKNFSLPVLSMIIGLLDGFNPCAMWTLLFLISLLLGMKDRRKMWILGSAFIISSAVVYFVFMSAWLNLILFLGFIVWLRIIIGLVALGGGSYSLKEFFTNKNIAGCKVINSDKKQKLF